GMATHLLVLHLISLRPPLSTLFPYTTLFRSQIELRRGRYVGFQHRPHLFQRVVVLVGFVRRAAIRGHDEVEVARTTTRWNRCGRDRKSTRLNSSHVATSHAVFCLKTKSYTS